MNKSRTLPKQSRTLPLYGNPTRGDGEDSGKYYRCWNCGFICDVDRDSLGGPDDKANVTPEAYTQKDQYANTIGHCEGAHGATQAKCEASGGTWSTTRYIAGGSGGCPMCFSPNYRGDY